MHVALSSLVSSLHCYAHHILTLLKEEMVDDILLLHLEWVSKSFCFAFLSPQQHLQLCTANNWRSKNPPQHSPCFKLLRNNTTTTTTNHIKWIFASNVQRRRNWQVMNHMNFASILNSALNLQFSMDPYMNVQYTDGSTIQFSTTLLNKYLYASWKNYRLECELGLINILRLESESHNTFKLVKSLYIHAFHWTSNKSLPPMCRWLMNLQISPHGSFVLSSNVQITEEFSIVYHRAFPQCAVPQCAVQWWIFNTFSIGLHLNLQFTIQFAMDPCVNEQLTDEFSTHVPRNDFGFQTDVWKVNIFALQG